MSPVGAIFVPFPPKTRKICYIPSPPQSFNLSFDKLDRILDRMKSHFNKQDETLGELMGKTIETRHSLAGLEHEARQPRLAMEGDVEPDTKTHKRTEDAAADRVVNRDSSSARKIDNGSMSLTSFGMIAEPPALSCRDNALINKGDEAPKPCLPPVEMRTLKAAGGLLPASTASTAMRTIFPRLLFFLSHGEETKIRNGRTNFNQLAPPCWSRAIQTKLRQNLVFDPGSCISHLHTCPFLGGWRALLCGEVFVWTPTGI